MSKIKLKSNESGTGTLTIEAPNTNTDKTLTLPTSDGTLVTTDGATFTGNVNFGDNDKAVFGAGSDLQIYHDGSNSYIKDAGTGKIKLLANEWNVNNAADTANMIVAKEGAEIKLHYNGSAKLATTSSGIDVTGDVTADGLTVDGTGTLSTIGNGTQQIRTYVDGDEVSLLTDGSVRLDLWTGGNKTMRLDANGDISFYENTGTTPYFFWDASTERLGIGTTNPLDALHIVSAVSSDYRGNLFLDDSTTGFAAGVGGQITFGAEYRSNGDHTEWAAIQGAKANSTDANYAGTLEFKTRANGGAMQTKMILDDSGNVGIGTTPKTWSTNVDALQIGDLGGVWVYDDGDNPEQMVVSENVYNDATATEKYIETDSATKYYQRNGEHKFFTAASGTADTAINWTIPMTINSSGNVGIGTSSPVGKLAVSDGTVVGEINPYSAASGCYIGTRTNHAVLFQANASEKMRINSNGNVGINQGAPAALLHVGYTDYGTGDVAIFSPGNIYFDANGVRGGRMHISGSTGYVGFGVVNPTVRIHLPGGSANSSNTGISAGWVTHSDYRLKENVSDIASAIDTVKQLRPVNFSWIEDAAAEANIQGFIAHEIQEQLPFTVIGEKDAVDDDGNILSQAVDYSKVVPILTASLQEAITKIETLETTVADLTTRIETLENP